MNDKRRVSTRGTPGAACPRRGGLETIDCRDRISRGSSGISLRVWLRTSLRTATPCRALDQDVVAMPSSMPRAVSRPLPSAPAGDERLRADSEAGEAGLSTIFDTVTPQALAPRA